MSFFDHLCDLLESDAPLPPASRIRLRDAFRLIRNGTPPAEALELPATARCRRIERDRILLAHWCQAWHRSTTQTAADIAREVRRMHCGHAPRWLWLRQADRLYRLPETARQVFNLITK